MKKISLLTAVVEAAGYIDGLLKAEQELHDYNKWLMEVWNPNQLHIPFVKDAPRAYLEYKKQKPGPSDKKLINNFIKYSDKKMIEHDTRNAMLYVDEFLNDFLKLNQ